MDRRTLISTGVLGSAALTLGGLLKAESASLRPRRDLSCIMIWLQGGPSTLDMWDLHPDAPAGIRSPFRAICTNVAGIEICEHLPLLARKADKYCLLRSVTHSRRDHEGAAHLMSTGWDTWPAQPRPALGTALQQLLASNSAKSIQSHLPGPSGPACGSLDHRLTDSDGGSLSSSRLESHLIAARRLVESGTHCVTVVDPGWDTHADQFAHMESELLPRLDQALYRLLGELDDRGLLETTLVMVMGEFGRSPQINGDAGRHHWPHVQSVFLAGGGIPGGTVIGASDPEGAYPTDRPIPAQDLAATLYHKFGIPLDAMVTASNGLSVPLLPEASHPIPELI